MNIIDEREKRTIYRKLKKKEFDEILTLSVDSGLKVRLLDEGTVVDAYGSPLFYIKKGVLKAFYDGLSEDYVGSINIGHTDLATFPERIVGTWKKSDLSLVDIGEGRQGLDVELNLMEEHPLVKALRQLPFSLGVSAEFGYHIDEAASENYGLEILDGVNIYDFAIVGEAGNVNSSGIQLKGGIMTKNLSELLGEDYKGTDLAELNSKLALIIGDAPDGSGNPPTQVEEPAEEPAEVPAEEPEAPVETPVEAEEEAVEPEAEEVPEAEEETAEEPAEEPESEEAEAPVDLSIVMKGIEDLKAEIAELKSENEELKSKLSAKTKAEKDFVEKFKNLSVSLTVEKKEEPVVESKTSYTDGIGELE